MGLLNAIGVNNGLSDFIAAHRGALTQFGTGLAAGPTIQQGIALGTQGLAQGSQADTAYADTQAAKQKSLDQINATVKYLQSNPAFADLVPIAQAGDGAAALTEAFKRSAPGYGDPNYGKPPVDETNTYQGRIAAGQAQGLTGKDLATYALTSKLPDGYGAVAQPDLPPVSFDQSAGVPDPAQQEQFLKALDPSTATIVKGIADYQLDPTKTTSLKDDQRQKILSLVQQYDPTFDMSQFGARSAMRKSITSGTYSQTLNSANLVIQHLDELAKAGEGLHNQSGLLTPWNSVANAAKNATGQPEITRFNEAKQAVGSELAKVFKGSGVSSEEEIKAWQSTFSDASSPEQLKQAVATAVALLKSRIDTIQNQYQSAMGKPANFKYLTAHSKQVLGDLGYDPTALDPGAGDAPAGPPAPGGVVDYTTYFGGQ